MSLLVSEAVVAAYIRVWQSISLAALGMLALSACSSLLPEGEGQTESPWHSYDEAQRTFDKIVPGSTRAEGLKSLKLDPQRNPNITILNYSDVLRRFLPSYSIATSELDEGVRECIAAKTACKGYEIDHRVIKRSRYGNFFADLLNFKRKVDIVGWRFKAVLLLKDDVVVYKLTGGQPSIREHEENLNPLGPFQGAGESGVLSRVAP
jgi:hypothetical protein